VCASWIFTRYERCHFVLVFVCLVVFLGADQSLSLLVIVAFLSIMEVATLVDLI
jgi:hypothetical protein